MRLLILLATFQHASLVAALPANGDGTWISYTVANGLPSNSVWGGVAIDNVGQVWAGFDSGDAWPGQLPTHTLISRLAGTNWITYSLPGCRVTPLIADVQVYAGTYCPGPPSYAGGGLSWFSSDGWVHFMPTDGMTGTYITAIASEGNDRVWLAAGDSLISHPYVNLLDHKGTPDKADDQWIVYDLSKRSINDVYSIAIDPAGNRWFGTNNGILVLSADGQTWMTYTADLTNYALVTDIAFDAKGDTWLATGQRVIRFDSTTWSYYSSREEAIQANYAAIMTSYQRNRVNPVSLPGLWAIEPDTGVWIIRADPSGSTAGVGFYDGNSWTIYTMQNSGLGSDMYVRGIAIDHQGNVWIGTRDSSPTSPGGLDELVPTPNFSLSMASNLLLVAPGEIVSTDILVSHLRGWVPTATLSIAGLPLAASAMFDSNPLTLTSHTSLAITTTTVTPLGIYPLSLAATEKEVAQTAVLTLFVVPQVYRYYWPIVFQNSGNTK